MSAFLKIASENFTAFAAATLVTLKLTSVSLALAMVIGLLIAFCKISGVRPLYGIAQLYITIIRGTPLIVQISFFYFGISAVLVLPAFWAGSLALAIHAGAYIAEIFRGSIQSINKGQMEAARSLGMSYWLAMRRIILPQAFKRAIPPLGNQFIIGLKDSSLVAYIGIAEIWGTSLSIAADNWQPFLTYLLGGCYYLVLVIIFTFLVHKLELKLDVENNEVSNK